MLNDGDRADMRGVLNDVHHQTEESIDEVLPRPRLTSEAALQELAINVGKCHARTFCVATRAHRGDASAHAEHAKPRNLPYFTLTLASRQAQRESRCGVFWIVTRALCHPRRPKKTRLFPHFFGNQRGQVPLDTPPVQGYDSPKSGNAKSFAANYLPLTSTVGCQTLDTYESELRLISRTGKPGNFSESPQIPISHSTAIVENRGEIVL
jgi:hypothetical protein